MNYFSTLELKCYIVRKKLPWRNPCECCLFVSAQRHLVDPKWQQVQSSLNLVKKKLVRLCTQTHQGFKNTHTHSLIQTLLQKLHMGSFTLLSFKSVPNDDIKLVLNTLWIIQSIFIIKIKRTKMTKNQWLKTVCFEIILCKKYRGSNQWIIISVYSFDFSVALPHQ